MASTLTKAQKEAREKLKREKITFQVKGVPDSQVMIPRYRLTPEHVNKTFQDEIEYVVDEAGTVVYPDRFMWECMPPPFLYFVVAKQVMELPPDDANDPQYHGDTQIVLWNVPMEVTETALNLWLKVGLEKKDETFAELDEAVKTYAKKIQENKERLDNVPFMNTNSTTDKGMAEERRMVMATLKKENEEYEKELEQAKESLEKERRRRNANKFHLAKQETHEKKKTSTWYVTFDSAMEANHAVDFDEWNQLKLSLGFKSKKENIPPVASFEDLDQDSQEFEVNMRGVIVQRMRQGQGCYTDWSWGGCYEGEFRRGLRHGKGKLYDKIGAYRGEFENDFRHGHGIQSFANGDVYEGEFGHTMYHYREPEILKHDFALGAPHGKGGKYTFADGSVYEGEFKEGRINGKGVYFNPATGERMEGEFLDGVLHGKGVHINQAKERYEGDFRFGTLHGIGKWESRTKSSRSNKFRDKDTITGSWECGKPHGKCVYEYRKGHTYSGYYKDGLREGPGSMIYGRVKTKFDRSTGKTHLLHDYEYQGTWVADRIQAQNYHVTVRDRMLPTQKQENKNSSLGYEMEIRDRFDFTTNFKSWQTLPFLHKIVFKESSKQRRALLVESRLIKEQKKKVKKIDQLNRSEFKRKRRWAIQLYKKVDRSLRLFRELENEREEESGEFYDDADLNEEELEEFDEEDEGYEEYTDEEDEEGSYFEENYYADSDWFSDEDDSSVQTDPNDARRNSFQFAENNSKFVNLRVSLVDIFENPPPKDKLGNSALKPTLDHYLVAKNLSKKNF